MIRVALGVEYDGADFHGWQVQRGAVRTVQATLEAALSKVANHRVELVCAGRTDAGVHALNQVVHFDTTAERRLRNWVLGANSELPKDVNVRWARFVSDAFHARFTALRRRYRYVILNRSVRSALQHQRMTWFHAPLNAEQMHSAGQALVGEHDFSSYRSLECQAKSPLRTLYELSVKRDQDTVVLEVEANAFLQHMVRNIAGVLMAIGRGERPVDWGRTVLQARDRTQGGVTAPAAGLSLIAVRYPDRFDLPSELEALGFDQSMD